MKREGSYRFPKKKYLRIKFLERIKNERFKFKFQNFQISSFKKEKNLFQGTTKICQGFHANEKNQIKKEQMEITHLKNNGTTKPSSFEV